jgi:uncharacterized protein
MERAIRYCEAPAPLRCVVLGGTNETVLKLPHYSGDFMRLVLLVLSFSMMVPAALASQVSPSTGRAMKILVHITHGPEAPTRAVLGFHVARAAVEEGHQVTIFLAGDAVQLLRENTLNQLVGLGTGQMRDIYDALAAAGVQFYLSGGSSQARGVSEQDLDGKRVQFGSPRDLVRLAAEHDRMFSY